MSPVKLSTVAKLKAALFVTGLLALSLFLTGCGRNRKDNPPSIKKTSHPRKYTTKIPAPANPAAAEKVLSVSVPILENNSTTTIGTITVKENKEHLAELIVKMTDQTTNFNKLIAALDSCGVSPTAAVIDLKDFNNKTNTAILPEKYASVLLSDKPVSVTLVNEATPIGCAQISLGKDFTQGASQKK